MNCIFCKKEITPIYMDILQSFSADHKCWNDAVVGTIRAGYGSRYDNDDFIICICDDCIEKHLQNQIKSYEQD